jgi:hypothetical protein
MKKVLNQDIEEDLKTQTLHEKSRKSEIQVWTYVWYSWQHNSSQSGKDEDGEWKSTGETKD